MNASPIHLHPASTAEPSESILQPDTLAAGLLVLNCALHLWLLPLHDASLKGVFFGAYVFISFVCALDITLHSRIFGWFGGALVCAAGLLAHCTSLIFGSPFHLHAGFAPFVLFSVVAQSLFLLLFVSEIALADEED